MKACPAIRGGSDLGFKEPRRPAVLAQQSSQALRDDHRLQSLLPTTGLDPQQPFFDPLLETAVHGLLFLAAIAAAAEHEGLVAVGRRAELHLQPVADRVPIFREQFPLELLEHALGRAHDVTPSALFQEGDVVGRDHAAVADPNPIGPAVAALHRLHDLLQAS